MLRLSATTLLKSSTAIRSPVSNKVRNLAATAQRPTTFKEKTFYQAWCMDAGAYPVMGVIAFAVVFSSGAMLYFISTHPDARVSKTSRSQIFRGELKEVK